MKKVSIFFGLIIAILAVSSVLFVSCSEEAPAPDQINDMIQNPAFEVKKSVPATNSNPLLTSLWNSDEFKNFNSEIGTLDTRASEFITYQNESGTSVNAIMTPIKSIKKGAYYGMLSVYREDLGKFASIILEVEPSTSSIPELNTSNVRLYTPGGAFIASSVAVENNETYHSAHKEGLAVAAQPVARGYWKCVADCVEDVLTDPFWGSLCGSICVACIAPPHAGCPPCLACLGGTVTGCLLGCAIWG